MDMILEETEYTLGNLEMYNDLGSPVPDALTKHYNDFIEDCLTLHLTNYVRTCKEDLSTQIKRVKKIQGKLIKMNDY